MIRKIGTSKKTARTVSVRDFGLDFAQDVLACLLVLQMPTHSFSVLISSTFGPRNYELVFLTFS